MRPEISEQGHRKKTGNNKTSARRRRNPRRRARIALFVVFTLALVIGAPVTPARPGQVGLPLTWLHWLLSPHPAAAAPAPPVPHQWSGTAAGRSSRASAASTRQPGNVGHAPGKGVGQLPLYQPHTLSRTPVTTPAMGVFDPATSRAVAADTTATSNTFANADGTFTRQVYSGPVNYRTSDGKWHAIDTSLAAGADGRLHQRANGPAMAFAGTGADPRLASVSPTATTSISWSLQGAAPAVPVTNGSSVIYPGILPGTDLEITSQTAGTKESIILNSPDAANSWVFPLHLDGLTARLAADGSVEYVDAAGTVEAITPAGVMSDSNFDPHSRESATSGAVTYRLTTTAGGGPALEVTADPAWLHDPQRVYPVTIDPSLTFSATGSTYDEKKYDPQDQSGEPDLRVGTSDPSLDQKSYSFLQFSGFTTTFANDTINSVTLNLYDLWAWTCAAEPFSINPITQSWTPSGVTHYPGPSFGGAIGSLTTAATHACQNTNLTPGSGDWMHVPLQTATFNNWLDGSPNYGLAITASQTNTVQWKRFASTNVSGYVPNLSVTYTPNTTLSLASTYPPNNYTSSSLTPQLVAKATDNTTITYTFTVLNASTLAPVASQTGASSTYAIPAGKLVWGQTYAWNVKVADTSQSITSPYSFISTPVPQPLITSRLAQNGGNGFNAQIGNYTTQATDADVTSVGPSLTVNRDYNSADPRLAEAFGGGWSSVFDSHVVEQSAGGVVQTVAVTFPEGLELAFGRNSDGTFVPPLGYFATFVATTTPAGYTLTDKQGMVYTFQQATGSGTYGITSIKDPNGRTVTFTYNGSNQITTETSAVSGRALHLTWSTPTGATSAHVATVATDPVTPGVPASALTWTYGYAGDNLTSVCPPTSQTACTTYGYTTGSGIPSATLNAGAQSYWRLAEVNGGTADSAVLANADSDNGIYNTATRSRPPIRSPARPSPSRSPNSTTTRTPNSPT